MKTPKLKCPHCGSHQILKRGSYLIRHNGRRIRRYSCKLCEKSFSRRTLKITYRQKKPYLNRDIYKLHCYGLPLRGISKFLGVSYRTVYRKFKWMGPLIPKVSVKPGEKLYLDEMETIEHTKAKPLSILLITDEFYNLHAAEVASMPAKGPLAGVSVKKYGFRPDHRQIILENTLKSISESSSRVKEILTDAKSSYVPMIKKYFPEVEHKIHNQADKKRHQERMHELFRKKKFDPLFPVNQRSAKLRADIRRLTRRSWCTTKKPQHLQFHLNMYCYFNNTKGKNLRWLT